MIKDRWNKKGLRQRMFRKKFDLNPEYNFITKCPKCDQKIHFNNIDYLNANKKIVIKQQFNRSGYIHGEKEK